MLSVMTVERVTISLPSDIRAAAQRAADAAGLPFSTAVAEALSTWVRGRLVDAWLDEFEAEHGAFTETELESIAAEAGVPYVPPKRSRSAA
jgi:hypothetical protein